MDDFSQMHIFFAVTTGAVIIVTALCGGVLVALFRFLYTLNGIAEHVHDEAEDIREDLSNLRSGLKKGFRFVPWLTFFGKSAKRISGKSTTRKESRKS